MIAAVLAAAALLTGYAEPRQLCSLSDPRIHEASGLAVVEDRVFTHNDSGDGGRFFEIGADCTTVAVHDVGGVTPVDWEDVAPGPDRTLWFADTGDNAQERETVAVHRVPVPGDAGRGPLPLTTWVFRYEDGPHDAEALLVHPRTGELVVVLRDKAGSATAYVPAEPLSQGRTGVLRRSTDVARLGLGGLGGVTGGAVSPAGDRVALRTLSAAYEWDVGADGLAASLAAEPRRITLPVQRQGESIAYRADGALLVGTEGEGAPLHVLEPGSTGPSAPSPSRTGEVVVDRGVVEGAEEPAFPSWTPLAIAAAALSGIAAWALWRRRRAARP